MATQAKVLPFDAAVKMALTASRVTDWDSPNAKKVFQWLIESCPVITAKDGFKFFVQADVFGFMLNMKKAMECEDMTFLMQRRGLCVDRIVDVVEFCESAEFFKQKGHIRPVVMDTLVELFNPDPEKQYIEAVLSGSIGWGKCLAGYTEVIDASSGVIRTIRDCAERGVKFLIPTMSNDGSIIYSEGTAEYSGVKHASELTLTSGFKATLSNDHPVKVRDDYKRLDKLIVDELVTCCAEYPENPTPFIKTDAEIKFLSYMCADGSCTGTPMFTNASQELWDDFTESVIEIGGSIGEYEQQAGLAVTRSIKNVTEILRINKLNCKAIHKRIPRWMVGVPKRQIALFLNRFFACDGSIYTSKPYKIECTLGSERLINDLVLLLSFLGVYARSVYAPKYCQGIQFDAWRVAVTDADSIVRFFDTIGNILSKEVGSTDLSSKSYRVKSNTNTQIVPVRYKDLNFAGKSKWARPEHQYFSRRVMALIAEEQTHQYNWTANANIRWERVVSVVDVGMIDVYDISVPETGNFVANGIVVHNTYFSYLALAYMIYQLSCLHNPQIDHDLAPGTSIVFIQQSKTFNLAKKVVFEQFSAMLKLTDYFTRVFPFDPQVKSELRFPKNITVIPAGGSDTAALGMNVYGGIIDEMNFMQKTKDSVQTQHTGEEEYDQAEKLYTTLIRRMKSRFIQKGKVPGKLLLVSSVNYPGDFTDRKFEEAKRDKTILAVKYSQWDALPSDRFSGERFKVEVGNEFKQSRILLEGMKPIDAEDVIDIPIEYKTEFERDLEAALRDLAGVATGTRHPFIPYRELIVQAQEKYTSHTGGLSLFKYDSCILEDIIVDVENPDWERIIDMDYVENCILDQSVPHCAHIDVGLTGDAAGLAIGHITGYKLLPSSKYFSEVRQEFVEVRDIRAPIYHIDGALQCLPPLNDEIDLDLLKELVLYLRGLMYVKWGTCDSYQSAMLIQGFRRGKIRAGVLSVDTSMAPYTEYKLAIKDERILIPPGEVLARETREVERIKEKDKIDHPDGGTKDVADAVAGVCYMLQQKEANFGRTGSSRSKRHRTDSTPNLRKVRLGKRRR